MAGDLQDLLEDLLAPLGGVSIRRMFGGRGVFKDGVMFALLSSRGVFYLKADAGTAPAFAAEGCEQWTPEMQGRTMAMPYWRAPERLLDEPDEFAEWARAAFAVAIRTAKPKTKKAPKRRPMAGLRPAKKPKPAKRR